MKRIYLTLLMTIGFNSTFLEASTCWMNGDCPDSAVASPILGFSVVNNLPSETANSMTSNVLVNTIAHGTVNNFRDKSASSAKAENVLYAPNRSCEEILDCDLSSDVFTFGRSILAITLDKSFNPGYTDPLLHSNQSRVRIRTEVEKCSCLEAKFFVMTGGDYKAAEKVIEIKIEEAKGKILKSYGKKFINDYSLYYEDAMFLINHSNVLNANNEAQVLCRGADKLEEKIAERCPRKSKSKINERMELIFSGFNFGEEKTLEERLSFINYNTIQRTVKDKDGDVTYFRNQYDQTRYGLRQSDEFKLLDKVLTGFFNSNDREKLGSTPYTGLEIISTHISRSLVIDFDNTIKNLFGGNLPSHVLEKWEKMRTSPTAKNDFEVTLKNYLLTIAPSHPALGAILLDPTVYRSFDSHTNGKKISSVFDEFENNFKDLASHMERRCKEMIEDFAGAVCIADDDVLNGVSKESLHSILDEENEEYDILEGVKDVIACRGGLNNEPAFQGLNKAGDNIVNSDLHTFLKENDSSKATDAYSVFARNLVGDSVHRDLIIATAEAGASSTPRQSSYDPSKNYLGRLRNSKLISSSGVVSDLRITAARSETTDSMTLPPLRKAEMNSETTSTATLSRNHVNIMKPYTIISDVKETKDVKKNDEVPDFLSHRTDKSEISSHISKLNNKELDELRKFKQNALKEKELDLNRQLEDEKTSLSQLKSQIDGLIAGKTAIKDVVNTSTRKVEAIPQETNVSVRRSIAANPSRSSNVDSQESVNTRSDASRAPASISPSMGGASGSMTASARRETAAATPRVGKDPSGKEAMAGKSGIVVQATSDVINSNKDISSNIVEYLKNADTETFIRFTQEGVVYKYKALENGVIVEKELHVSINDVDPEALVEIAKESEIKLSSLQRKYSYETLKLIISEEALQKI